MILVYSVFIVSMVSSLSFVQLEIPIELSMHTYDHILMSAYGFLSTLVTSISTADPQDDSTKARANRW